uniref:Uncharacterized protein n=1 Tax=Lygus hesperus TaxID=30085 RepID=A0A0K8SB38_LYGHE
MSLFVRSKVDMTFSVRNCCIVVQILVVISYVTARHYQHYGSRMAPLNYKWVPVHAKGQRAVAPLVFKLVPVHAKGQRAVNAVNNGKMKYLPMDITPSIEDLVRKALAKAKYDAADIKLDKVLGTQKHQGGRMVDAYRVSYSNPVTNQHCFFSFLAQNGINPQGLVCNKPCAGNVCKVDSKLVRSSSYDSSYSKDWEDRKYHEKKEEHQRDYSGAFQNDDTYNNNYGK